MMGDAVSTDSLILYIKKIFHNSTDLFVEKTEWQDGPAVICYYTIMTEGAEVNQQLELNQKKGSGWAYRLGKDCNLFCSCFFRYNAHPQVSVQVS